jgi:hypothetical protein
LALFQLGAFQENNMRVERTLILPCKMEQAVAALMQPRLMAHVAAPVVAFAFVQPPALPARWEPGRYVVSLRLFGLLPMGYQTIGIELLSQADDFIHVRDNGHSALISRWDHHILLEPADEGCRYTDRVDVEAGLLTPFVWAFASLFFAHRQRRLLALAKQGFRYPSN